MELIKNLPSKKIKGRTVSFALFLCPFCLQEVGKRIGNGVKAKSCGCMAGIFISQSKKGKKHTEEHNNKISISTKGENNPMYGKNHTEKTRQLIKENRGDFNGENNPMYGKNQTQETRQKIAKSLQGHPAWNKGLTKETDIRIKNISNKNIGKKRTEEQKQKMGVGNIGKIRTEEFKKKLSEAHKGKVIQEETRQKIKVGNKGKKRTEKTRQRISVKAKERYKNPENNPNWQGGISFELYGLDFNKDLKGQILERDTYTCQDPNCEHKTNLLDIHHIDFDKKNNNSENLITLCDSCHMKTNGKKKRQYFTEFYQNIMVCRIVECLL